MTENNTRVKVFITGATGQVGAQLAIYLADDHLLGIQDPSDIICLIRNPEKANYLKEIGVTLIKGDLSDRSLINEIFQTEPIKFVFHLAANVYVYATYDEMYEANYIGTKNVADAFVNSDGCCMIFTSSIATYASFRSKGALNIDENYPMGPTEPDSDVPYAITKRLAEQMIQDYQQKYPDKRFVITRLGPITGPGDRQILPSLVKVYTMPIPKLIAKGRDFFSLTSPLDVARAQVFLTQQCKDIPGEVFNIANEDVTYKTLFSYVAEYYNRKPPWVSFPYWIYRSLLPIFGWICKRYPNNKTIQTILSPSSLEYIGKTFRYQSDKIKQLGFEFTITVKESVFAGLKQLDPNRELMRVGTFSNYNN